MAPAQNLCHKERGWENQGTNGSVEVVVSAAKLCVKAGYLYVFLMIPISSPPATWPGKVGTAARQLPEGDRHVLCRPAFKDL